MSEKLFWIPNEHGTSTELYSAACWGGLVCGEEMAALGQNFAVSAPDTAVTRLWKPNAGTTVAVSQAAPSRRFAWRL